MSEDSTPRAKGARASAKPGHVKPVDGGTAPVTLSPNHLEDLRSSGLTDETITAAKLRSEGKSSGVSKILGWGWKNGAALVFPFFDYDSRKLVLARVKPDKPRLRGKKRKPVKYEQPPDTGPVPYFGPGTIREQRLDKPRLSVYWAEGEKKTLTLDQLGLAVIGITGCHVWNDSETYRNGDGLTWSKQLRKYAERFVKGRKHVICYDSDAFDNDNVMLALQRLAGLLLADGAASVWFVRIPPSADKAVKGVGIDDYYLEHGEDATRALLKAAERIEVGSEIAPIPPKDPLLKLCSLKWLRAAKLPPDLRLPPRFDVRRDRSLWLEPDASKPDGDWKESMRSILIPTALLEATDDETEQRIEVAYFAREGWRRAVVDRKAIRDARRALSELPADVAIDSNNAALVVAWLSEYMRHNEHRMELRKFVSQCGWHEIDSGECFVADVPIVRAGGRVRLDADTSGDRGSILCALAPKGTLDAHRAALAKAFDEDSQAALMILSALAAPLLRPLRAPNFGIHLAGDSSRGKTSKLVCAASVFGDPRNDQWLASWNTTATAMELRAETLCDLPLCYDEVGAGDRAQIERSIYMLVNGSGKGRAQRSLKLRKTPSWRTVVLSTGEHSLASEKANTGAQVRIVQFRVNGFGELDAAGVDSIREACERNAGHVGRLWLKTLVDIDDWQPLRELFVSAKAQFREQKEGSLMQRQAVYFALLAVAEHLASKSLGFGVKGGGTVRGVFMDTDETGDVVSAGERAVDVVAGWIASEPDAFPVLTFASDGGLTAKRKANARKLCGVHYVGRVHLLPDELRTVLERNGLSYSGVLAAWKASGVTDCDKGRTKKRLRWDGQRLCVVAVKSEALGLTVDTQTDFGGDGGG